MDLDRQADSTDQEERKHKTYYVRLTSPDADLNVNSHVHSKPNDLTRPKIFAQPDESDYTQTHRKHTSKSKERDSIDEQKSARQRSIKKRKKKKRYEDIDIKEEGRSPHRRRHREDRYRHLVEGSTDTEDEIHTAIEGGRRKPQAEVKKMNIYSENTGGEEVDERLKKLEQTTERSLYNIEALLRNAVFSRQGSQGVSVVGPGTYTPRDYNLLL